MVSHLHHGWYEFAFFRPGANSVAIAGTFNHWQSHTHCLIKNDDGWWRIQLNLSPGKHAFKYVIDETIWEADFATYGVEMCQIGGWNSIVWVDDKMNRICKQDIIRKRSELCTR